MELKMENPTHTFRKTNLVLQLIYELQIESKNYDGLELPKGKRGHFFNTYFVRRNFANICVLSQCIV